jgi:hypothetical protein
VVTLKFKLPASWVNRRASLQAGILIGMLAFLISVLLWLMPKPFSRFEYMIAGTAATVSSLLVVFFWLNPDRKAAGFATVRTVRRNGQSS